MLLLWAPGVRREIDMLTLIRARRRSNYRVNNVFSKNNCQVDTEIVASASPV